MTEKDYDLTELRDEEDSVYLIGVDERTTERMLETIDERFGEVFEDATYIVFTADLVAEGSLEVYSFDSDEVKEQMEDFREAEDAGEQMVAIRDMVEGESDG